MLFFGDDFEHEDPWDHYAVLTNFPLDLHREASELSTKNNVDNLNQKEKLKSWTIQEVFEFHQKRGNAENFIREEKDGYDLKHFPCQSLKANHAYGVARNDCAQFASLGGCDDKAREASLREENQTPADTFASQNCSAREICIYENHD